MNTQTKIYIHALDQAAHAHSSPEQGMAAQARAIRRAITMLDLRGFQRQAEAIADLIRRNNAGYECDVLIDEKVADIDFSRLAVALKEAGYMLDEPMVRPVPTLPEADPPAATPEEAQTMEAIDMARNAAAVKSAKRPLDLTKPVETRDGRPVRILCTDAENAYYPVIALISEVDRGEHVTRYTQDGRYMPGGEHPRDLQNVVRTETVYVNLYRLEDGTVYVGRPLRDAELAQKAAEDAGARARVVAMAVPISFELPVE